MSVSVMTTSDPFDWVPLSDAAQANQIASYDQMRRRCPVARSEALHWSLLRHADVLEVLGDPDTYSNAVSQYRSVPNGMDPPEHDVYRVLIEPFFSAEVIRDFEPACRRIAQQCVAALPRGEPVEMVVRLASEYALQVQTAFMGWPVQLHEPLRQWVLRSQHAVRSEDREASAEVAMEFDGYIRAILAQRRAAGRAGEAGDVTDRLMALRIDGELLPDEDIVSIVRNWTVGELGTIVACVAILAHHLASRPALQTMLRQTPGQLPAAIDEILRLDAPLIANRRVARRDAVVGGRQIAAGERITVLWASANRDEAVFGDPDEIRLDRDPSLNLLYGAGLHVCPGAPLARLELDLICEALLTGTRSLEPVPGAPAQRAAYPAGGYSRLLLQLA